MVSRRLLISGSIGAVLLDALPIRVLAGETPAYTSLELHEKQKQFKLYDQLNFRDRPSSLQLGLEPITVVYADQLWPDRKKHYDLDIDYIVARYKDRPLLGKSNLLCLDIEHWRLRRVGAKEFDKSVTRYLNVIDVFRDLYPQARIGLFEFSPNSFYPLYDQFANDMVDPSLQETWEMELKALRVISDKLDVLFPQLYSRWPSALESWERCTRVVMSKARQIARGRPVIPFIWPQFWRPAHAIIPEEYWSRILDVVCETADSAVLWSIYRSAPQWRDDFGWWEATHAFLEEEKLS